MELTGLVLNNQDAVKTHAQLVAIGAGAQEAAVKVYEALQARGNALEVVASIVAGAIWQNSLPQVQATAKQTVERKSEPEYRGMRCSG